MSVGESSGRGLQDAFMRLALERKAWRRGDFTLKSGLRSDVFFDIGRLCRGVDLALIGRAFAAELLALEAAAGREVDMLFGPAYKGIPLVVVTAQALAVEHQRDLLWGYDRKQEKDHGEGGRLVGAALRGRRVAIIDDVLTAGTATRATARQLRDAGAEVALLLVAVDREGSVVGARGRTAAEALVAEGLVGAVGRITRRSDFEGFGNP